VISKSHFLENIHEVSTVLKKEKAVIIEDNELLACGDLHGDLQSLNYAFKLRDELGIKKIAFLGDFIDRGSHQIEVLQSLIERKIQEPNNVILIRGNHEETTICSNYGFLTELKKAKMEDLFPEIEQLFGELPVFLHLKNYAVMAHGGIPLEKNRVVQLDEIKKIPGNIGYDHSYSMECMWNDPVEAWYSPDQLPQDPIIISPRYSLANCFTKSQVKEFTEDWGVKFLIRAHVSLPEGYKWYNDRVLSIFSSASSFYKGFNRTYAECRFDTPPIIHQNPGKT